MARKLMQEDTDADGINMKIFYDDEDHMYEVVVSDEKFIKERKIPAQFVPTFGMDVSDLYATLNIAEELASEIDADRLK